MAVIGNLVANLVADTSGFSRPMIAASAVVGNVASSVASAAATTAGGFGKLATGAGKASVDVSRSMSNIIKSVGAASASVGVGFAKAIAVTRESGAKVASIQAKTEAQLARQQALGLAIADRVQQTAPNAVAGDQSLRFGHQPPKLRKADPAQVCRIQASSDSSKKPSIARQPSAAAAERKSARDSHMKPWPAPVKRRS